MVHSILETLSKQSSDALQKALAVAMKKIAC
jgi:hypothetical protein